MASSVNSTSVILLLDLRTKTFIGIDLISFDSSPNFHGITNIPSGFHCLYTGTDAVLSIRHCHWLKLDKSHSTQTHVLQWMPEIESLGLLDHTSDRAQAASREVPSLRGRGLVDYAALQDANSDLLAKQSAANRPSTENGTDLWPSLSRYITERTLDRILGGPESRGQSWTLSSISSAPSDVDTIPGLSAKEAAGILQENQATVLNLISVNLKHTWPEGSVGRDRTEKARDRSWYLGHLIDRLISTGDHESDKTNKQEGAKELLAEIQFCFLMVLTLANYSCLEQWKRLLGVLFTCKAALDDVEGFFIEVVKVLRTQLERVEDVEGGLFEMGDENGSAWLRGLLKTFRSNVNESRIKDDRKGGLHRELVGLEEWLRSTYGWEDETTLLRKGLVELEDGERVEVQMDGLDAEEETGEYAPVVVDM